MTAPRFYASYEDVAKLEAGARAEGWREGESFLDYVEAEDSRFQTAAAFPTKDAAVAWIQEAIGAGKTAFGLGDIDEIVAVPRAERCDACTCCGEKPVKRYVVSDEGIDHEEDRDDCYFEESAS